MLLKTWLEFSRLHHWSQKHMFVGSVPRAASKKGKRKRHDNAWLDSGSALCAWATVVCKLHKPILICWSIIITGFLRTKKSPRIEANLHQLPCLIMAFFNFKRSRQRFPPRPFCVPLPQISALACIRKKFLYSFTLLHLVD